MRYILQSTYERHGSRHGYKIAAYDGYYGLFQWSDHPECPEFCQRVTGFLTRMSNWPIPESECLTELPEPARFDTFEELQAHVAETDAARMDWEPVP